MKCKEIQDLILTDYLDGEMNREEEVTLETHIADCRRCREFEAAARKAVKEPIHHSERARPHDDVWHKIRAQLVKEQKERKSFSGLMNRFYSSLALVKPAFASAAVMVLLLGTIFLMSSPKENGIMTTRSLDEQIDSLAYLVEGSNQFTTDEEEDFGTSIEEYFL